MLIFCSFYFVKITNVRDSRDNVRPNVCDKVNKKIIKLDKY